MKRFFKFALVALATAAVAVACQKPEQQPEKIALKGISLNKQAVELAIGAKETLTVKFDPENVTEKPTIEWSSSAPAVATVAEGEVTAVAAGEATITAKAGSFTATCKVTVKEEQPEPGDFTSPDWANIGAITNGNHTFKFTKDDKNAYFFSERTSEGRYNEIWGGKGYIYFAFDFDNNLETGETLNENGKYEYIGFIYCFGEKPKVEIVKAGDCLPEAYTVDNIIARGSADDNSVKVEYCVPLADLPQLPENFTIYTWGNKDMAKVIYKYPYEEPAPVDNWDYTPSDKYLAETNLWKPADGLDAVNWTLGEGLTTPEVSFSQSTYTFTLAEESNDIQSTQFRVVSNNITLDPAKKYNFYCKVYSSAGTKLWLKAHPDPNTHWPELFETAGYDVAGDRMVIEAGETKEIALENIEASLYPEIITKQCIMFDLSPHAANNLIHIKDIIVEEVGGEGPVAGTVYTLTDANLPTAYEKDAGGSYVETIVTEENIQYNIFTVANYGSGIQIRKEGGYISNHTAFESIKTIKVTCHPDKSWYPSNLVLYAGTAENPSETVITATSDDNTSTFDLSAGNYTHFKLANTSTYAVYLEKVEITGVAGEAPAPAPASIKLDGDLSDWDAVEGVEAGSFKVFKFASDADNIYMYFKIKRANIIAAKTEPFVFNWRRYIAFGIDADNNAETGTAVTFAGMNIPGCEIAGNFYPFRGTATSASGTDNVEIVNGVEEQGGVTTEIGSNVPDGADKKVSAFGKVDDDFVYVEAGFARADVGSPAAGTIKIQLSLAWDLTDILEYSLK